MSIIRSKYTTKDEIDMWSFVKYLIRKGEAHALKGNGVWDLYITKTGSTRTTSSLTSHFRKKMLDRLAEAEISLQDILFIHNRIPLNYFNTARFEARCKEEDKLELLGKLKKRNYSVKGNVSSDDIFVSPPPPTTFESPVEIRARSRARKHSILNLTEIVNDVIDDQRLETFKANPRNINLRSQPSRKAKKQSTDVIEIRKSCRLNKTTSPDVCNVEDNNENHPSTSNEQSNTPRKAVQIQHKRAVPLVRENRKNESVVAISEEDISDGNVMESDPIYLDDHPNENSPSNRLRQQSLLKTKMTSPRSVVKEETVLTPDLVNLDSASTVQIISGEEVGTEENNDSDPISLDGQPLLSSPRRSPVAQNQLKDPNNSENYLPSNGTISDINTIKQDCINNLLSTVTPDALDLVPLSPLLHEEVEIISSNTSSYDELHFALKEFESTFEFLTRKLSLDSMLPKFEPIDVIKADFMKCSTLHTVLNTCVTLEDRLLQMDEIRSIIQHLPSLQLIKMKHSLIHMEARIATLASYGKDLYYASMNELKNHLSAL